MTRPRSESTVAMMLEHYDGYDGATARLSPACTDGARNPRLTGLVTDNKDVRQSGDESVLQGVLHVDQVETTFVLFSVGDDTNTSQVTTTSNHDQLSGVELDEVSDLAGSQVDLDGVVGLDQWVWVSDGSTVVGDGVWDTSLAQLDLLDLTQLVGSLLGGDSVDSESTLDVVDQSEVFVGGFETDDVHETGWEGRVGSDLSVDLDVFLHQDSLDFSTVQSVLKSVSQENNERQGLAQLVGTLGRSWSLGDLVVDVDRHVRVGALGLQAGDLSLEESRSLAELGSVVEELGQLDFEVDQVSHERHVVLVQADQAHSQVLDSAAELAVVGVDGVDGVLLSGVVFVDLVELELVALQVVGVEVDSHGVADERAEVVVVLDVGELLWRLADVLGADVYTEEVVFEVRQKSVEAQVEQVVLVADHEVDGELEKRLDASGDEDVVDPQHDLDGELVGEEREEPSRRIHRALDASAAQVVEEHGRVDLQEPVELVQHEVEALHVRQKQLPEPVLLHERHEQGERLQLAERDHKRRGDEDHASGVADLRVEQRVVLDYAKEVGRLVDFSDGVEEAGAGDVALDSLLVDGGLVLQVEVVLLELEVFALGDQSPHDATDLFGHAVHDGGIEHGGAASDQLLVVVDHSLPDIPVDGFFGAHDGGGGLDSREERADVVEADVDSSAVLGVLALEQRLDFVELQLEEEVGRVSVGGFVEEHRLGDAEVVSERRARGERHGGSLGGLGGGVVVVLQLVVVFQVVIGASGVQKLRLFGGGLVGGRGGQRSGHFGSIGLHDGVRFGFRHRSHSRNIH